MIRLWRLFVGIEAGPAWTAHLAVAADRLRRSLGNQVRWVKPEQYHLTVVFLGDQPPEQVQEIEAALQVATNGMPPFSLRLLDVRRLGRREQGPLVAEVHDRSGALRALRASLDAELQARGIAFDGKPLRPHITLGRVRDGAMLGAVPRINLGAAPPLTVREVRIVKSDLQPGGPRYEAVGGATLGGGPPSGA